MALEYDDPIGTGQTYTTIGAWETALNTGTFTGDRRGRLLGEAFNQAVTFDGGTSSVDAHLIVTANSGDEHDGRANEVSGIGNARNEYTGTGRPFNFGDNYQEFSWLEVYAKGAWGGGFRNANTTQGYINIHHNLIHAQGQSIAFGGIETDQGGHFHIHRNIVYAIGNGQDCIHIQNSQTNGSYVLYNTCWIGYEGVYARADRDADGNYIKNNVSFTVTSSCYDFDSEFTLSNNAATDTTGDPAGLDSLTPSNELTNPTTTYTSTDLTLKDASATIYRYSSDNAYSPTWTGSWDTTFDEIDVPISDRNSTIPTSQNWSLGADELVSSAYYEIINILWVPEF